MIVESSLRLLDRLSSTNRRLVGVELAQEMDNSIENLVYYEATPSAAEHSYCGFELATVYTECYDLDHILKEAERSIQERRA